MMVNVAVVRWAAVALAAAFLFSPVHPSPFDDPSSKSFGMAAARDDGFTGYARVGYHFAPPASTVSHPMAPPTGAFSGTVQGTAREETT